MPPIRPLCGNMRYARWSYVVMRNTSYALIVIDPMPLRVQRHAQQNACDARDYARLRDGRTSVARTMQDDTKMCVITARGVVSARVRVRSRKRLRINR